MADNTTNESVADIEAEIAASRDRLARNIDEIVFRAQPKTIIRGQKEQLVSTLKSKYAGLMGTSQDESYRPASEQKVDVKGDAKAKVGDLKAQASAKVAQLKDQASAKVDDVKAQRAAASSDEAPRTVAMASGEHRQDGTHRGQEGGDVVAQARVKADQARLKLDELTHDEDGELRTDRIATALAATGAVLVALGAARRAGN